MRVGTTGSEGDIIVVNGDGAEVIQLNGDTGDIILRNADAAEHFEVADAAQAPPGTLMVLNREGKLEPSSAAYDKKVVGVVAGAGNYRPGIVLGHRSGDASSVPVSVLGKASCKADAAYLRNARPHPRARGRPLPWPPAQSRRQRLPRRRPRQEQPDGPASVCPQHARLGPTR